MLTSQLSLEIVLINNTKLFLNN